MLDKLLPLASRYGCNNAALLGFVKVSIAKQQIYA